MHVCMHLCMHVCMHVCICMRGESERRKRKESHCSLATELRWHTDPCTDDADGGEVPRRRRGVPGLRAQDSDPGRVPIFLHHVRGGKQISSYFGQELRQTQGPSARKTISLRPRGREGAGRESNIVTTRFCLMRVDRDRAYSAGYRGGRSEAATVKCAAMVVDCAPSRGVVRTIRTRPHQRHRLRVLTLCPATPTHAT